MFRRRAAPTKTAGKAARSEPFTYIQRGTTIVGELRAEGRVRVHGVLRGDVCVAGALEVAETGLVEGKGIEADEVKIIGRVVVERLVARGKVEIWSGGELIGDVSAASLDIEEGARFTGRSEMHGGQEGAEALTATAAAAHVGAEEPDAADGAGREDGAGEAESVSAGAEASVRVRTPA